MQSLVALLATPLILACPGAGASLSIEDTDQGRVILAFCNPEQCQEAMSQLESGETVVVKETLSEDVLMAPEEDSQIVTRISPMGGDRYHAAVQFAADDEPEKFNGKLSIGSGARGGCGADFEVLGLSLTGVEIRRRV